MRVTRSCNTKLPEGNAELSPILSQRSLFELTQRRVKDCEPRSLSQAHIFKKRHGCTSLYVASQNTCRVIDGSCWKTRDTTLAEVCWRLAEIINCRVGKHKLERAQCKQKLRCVETHDSTRKILAEGRRPSPRQVVMTEAPMQATRKGERQPRCRIVATTTCGCEEKRDLRSTGLRLQELVNGLAGDDGGVLLAGTARRGMPT